MSEQQETPPFLEDDGAEEVDITPELPPVVLETKPLFPSVVLMAEEERTSDTAPLPTEQGNSSILETVISQTPIEPPLTPFIRVAHRCHVGQIRRRNEDSAGIFVTENGGEEMLPTIGLFVVADGMGGHFAGHEASRKASRLFMHHLLEKVYLPLLHRDGPSGYQEPIQEVMLRGVQIAHQSLQNPDPEKDSGTTLTAGLMVGKRLYIVHVGDTRAYLLSNGVLEQITTDHSIVQRLVDAGQLTAEEAVLYPQKNFLYRALGQQGALDVDAYTRSLPRQGTLLICSDGLWGLIPDPVLSEVLQRDISLEDRADVLLDMALKAGGHDNITGILVEFTV